jgi:hypothetical protein
VARLVAGVDRGAARVAGSRTDATTVEPGLAFGALAVGRGPPAPAGDVLLNWLTTLLQVLHWFNPVIWFAFARMRADREEACDALALARGASNDRAAYGATILKLVSGLGSTRPAPGLVGISEGKSNLKHRIRMITSHRNPRRGSFLAVMILLTLSLVSLTDARATRDLEETGGVESQEAAESVPEEESSDPLEPGFDGDGIQPGIGRQPIQSKLDEMVLTVGFDRVALPVILDYLHWGTQIDFCISTNVIVPRSAAPRIEHTTGQIIPPDPIEPLDMNRVTISIDPKMHNIRLADLLEAIVRVASHPIRYSIEESASSSPQNLLTNRSSSKPVSFVSIPTPFWKRLTQSVPSRRVTHCRAQPAACSICRVSLSRAPILLAVGALCLGRHRRTLPRSPRTRSVGSFVPPESM